jgi:hypothetical protein
MSTSLLDWILALFRDPDARAAFQDDPRGFAADNGFDRMSAADFRDALSLIADSRSASYDHRGDHGRGDEARPVHYPPPPHPDHNDDGPRYLSNYITNNYEVIEKNETNIDNSVHQDIDTGGGDFSQVIDNDPLVASGEGAVAAGGDIEGSTITTGDGNVVGDGNHAVTGGENTTAFGSGDATTADISDSRFGAGSGVSFGGDASGSSSDNDTVTSVRNSGSGETSVNAAGDHGYADQYTDQSSSDHSITSNYEDNSNTNNHDTVNSNNDSRYSDSHDTSVEHA